MLQSVLQKITTLLPALQGPVVADCAEQSQGKQAGLALALLSHWQTAQPQAGRLYWCARSWGMLMWQPAYLQVLAVHGANAALKLDSVHQVLKNGFTAGFSIADHAVVQGELPELIVAASQSLQRYHQLHYADLCLHYPYSAKQAACMSVDCVLAALLYINRRQHWSYEQLAHYTELWLHALQWQKHGNLMQVEVDQDASETVLHRQGCCQHFRIPGEEACSTCPRWPMPERIARLRAEIIEERKGIARK